MIVILLLLLVCLIYVFSMNISKHKSGGAETAEVCDHSQILQTKINGILDKARLKYNKYVGFQNVSPLYIPDQTYMMYLFYNDNEFDKNMFNIICNNYITNDLDQSLFLKFYGFAKFKNLNILFFENMTNLQDIPFGSLTKPVDFKSKEAQLQNIEQTLGKYFTNRNNAAFWLINENQTQLKFLPFTQQKLNEKQLPKLCVQINENKYGNNILKIENKFIQKVIDNLNLILFNNDQLRILNFQLENGKNLLIQGDTGCGKTTLSLICFLWHIQKFKISPDRVMVLCPEKTRIYNDIQIIQNIIMGDIDTEFISQYNQFIYLGKDDKDVIQTKIMQFAQNKYNEPNNYKIIFIDEAVEMNSICGKMLSGFDICNQNNCVDEKCLKHCRQNHPQFYFNENTFVLANGASQGTSPAQLISNFVPGKKMEIQKRQTDVMHYKYSKIQYFVSMVNKDQLTQIVQSLNQLDQKILGICGNDQINIFKSIEANEFNLHQEQNKKGYTKNLVINCDNDFIQYFGKDYPGFNLCITTYLEKFYIRNKDNDIIMIQQNNYNQLVGRAGRFGQNAANIILTSDLESLSCISAILIRSLMKDVYIIQQENITNIIEEYFKNPNSIQRLQKVSFQNILSMYASGAGDDAILDLSAITQISENMWETMNYVHKFNINK